MSNESTPDSFQKAIARLESEIKGFYSVRVGLESKNRAVRQEQIAARMQNEPASRRALDDACRHWIERGNWPGMSQEQGVILSDRFAEALMFAKWLSHHGFSVPGKTEAQILNFLLIECWETIGVFRQWAYTVGVPPLP
jgi:hypothetical protein